LYRYAPDGSVTEVLFDADYILCATENIAHAMPVMPTLHAAHFAYSDVTDEGLIALAKKAPNLVTVNLENPQLITGDSAPAALAALPRLKHVYLSIDATKLENQVIIAKFQNALGDRFVLNSDQPIRAQRDQFARAPEDAGLEPP
jgi:hypothetical protein